MNKIGVLYLDREHFADEANQSIGAPALTSSVVMKRRAVTSRLSNVGAKMKFGAIDFIKKTFGVDVKLQWSQYAGCSMCPCSPGFNILTESKNLPDGLKSYYRRKIREQERFSIFIKDSSYDLRYSEYGVFSKLENSREKAVSK